MNQRNVILGIVALFLAMIGIPIGGVFVYGLTLPDAYVTVVSGVIAAEPESVYDLLADTDRQGAWRPGATQVQPVEGQSDLPMILVTSGGTELALKRVEAVRPQRVVWEVVPSKKHVFQGAWAYEIREHGKGESRVIITEHGIIDSPLARGVTHGLLGTDQYAKASLKTLGRALDVGVTIDAEAVEGTPAP